MEGKISVAVRRVEGYTLPMCNAEVKKGDDIVKTFAGLNTPRVLGSQLADYIRENNGHEEIEFTFAEGIDYPLARKDIAGPTQEYAASKGLPFRA